MNIKPIEKSFSASFSVRGDILYIKGVDEEVNAIEKIFKEMIYILNTTNKLNPSDVETIINLTAQGKEIINGKSYNNIILYTKKDSIKAKTPNQIEYLKIMKENDICFAVGPAGTGKTFLAVAFALSALKKGIVERIVLARPAVEAGESLGFLPGDFKEKIDPYLRPLLDALQDMLPGEQLRSYLEKGVIEIVPLAYMRGRTLNHSYVILDEAQNSTALQMKMFLTRLGPNSKAIITGDITQIDLPSHVVSGLIEAKAILKNVDGVGFVNFNKGDVVRHKLVKDIINAYEKYTNGNSKN
ncbi:phoH-like protein [bacterium BMS3Abin04]|nr:phoH-like protein [bacterium BMS3Abin04]